MAFYLKYRPQKFSELAGLENVKKIIIGFLKQEQIPHALLFAGPKGTGKTSTARILAKAINCTDSKKKSYEPCNKCKLCRAITIGTALDLIEIDAASNRGIDDIRLLREKAGLVPVQGKYKIYIIDEAHMLTTPAFNALLKTLEEPPPRVIFILCTTNPEKILPTILSRCMRINFYKASDKEVIASLKEIIEGEKLSIASGILKKIAREADGSFRDAQKILEELSFLGRKITLKKAGKVLSQPGNLHPRHLLTCLEKGDFIKAMEEVKRITASDIDLFNYTKALLIELRRRLHSVWGILEQEEKDKEQYEEKKLLRYVAVFSKAAGEIKSSPLPALPLELAVNDLLLRNEKKENFSEGKTISKKHFSKKVVKKKETVQKELIEKTKRVNGDQWHSMLKKIFPENHSIGAFLKSAQPVSLIKDKLTVGVYYRFHKECFEKEKNRQIIERAANDVFGHPVRLFCQLFDEKPRRQNNQLQNNLEKEDSYEIAEEIFGGEKND